MRLFYGPSVDVVGRPSVSPEGLAAFLERSGVTWETDSEVGAEVLCETAGRTCYMSFAKPRPGGNKAYLDHLFAVGHTSVLEHATWNFVISGVSRALSHELVRHRVGVGISQLSQRYVDESVAEYVVPPALRDEVRAAEAFLLEEGQGVTWAAVALALRDDRARAGPEAVAGLKWLETVLAAHAGYVWLGTYLTERAVVARHAVYAAHVEAGRLRGPLLPRDEWHRAVLNQEDRTGLRKEARQAARSVLPNATETKIFWSANARALRHFLDLRASRHADTEIRRLAHALWLCLKKESPNLFGDYEEVALSDGTFELTTPHRKA